jgi:hypothetical protein
MDEQFKLENDKKKINQTKTICRSKTTYIHTFGGELGKSSGNFKEALKSPSS